MNIESDEHYRDRLILAIPEGAVYTAEDIGDSSGSDLDDIGARHDCPRLGQKLPTKFTITLTVTNEVDDFYGNVLSPAEFSEHKLRFVLADALSEYVRRRGMPHRDNIVGYINNCYPSPEFSESFRRDKVASVWELCRLVNMIRAAITEPDNLQVAKE